MSDPATREFDYVIVGGGTAGLVLAGRLSEDPNITVAVLEAGKDVSKEMEVLVPGAHAMPISSFLYK